MSVLVIYKQCPQTSRQTEKLIHVIERQTEKPKYMHWKKDKQADRQRQRKGRTTELLQKYAYIFILTEKYAQI